MFLKNSGNFGDALGILLCAVTRWHNAFRFGSVEMRTPIGNDSVAAVRCVSTSPITDDRVIRNAFCNWERVHAFYETIVGRKRVDAVGYPCHPHDGWIILDRRLQDLMAKGNEARRRANDAGCNSADWVFSDHASAMGRRDENDARNVGPVLEDQRFG